MNLALSKLASLKSLPNKRTLARIAVIPVLLVVYPLGHEYIFLRISCAALFAMAAITDFFDGYLARKFNNESRIGALLDPIADKLLITCTVILLTNTGKLAAILGGLILCREVAINGLRLAASDHGFEISVSHLGKLKTFLQAGALFLLMVDDQNLRPIGMVGIWAALIVSYYSAYQYWIHFWENNKKGFQEDSETKEESALDNP